MPKIRLPFHSNVIKEEPLIPDQEKGRSSFIMIAPDWHTITKKKGANLPHWQCHNAVYNVSFRLADSIPQAIQKKWTEEKKLLSNFVSVSHGKLANNEHALLRRLMSKKVEAFLDKGYGECLLKKPEVSIIVQNSLQHFDGIRYQLHAWCIMPNHVHVIVEPFSGKNLSIIIHSWKSYTANRINNRLNRTGRLWQHEAYDHIIRSESEYWALIEYIWKNPVNAGLRDCPRWRIDGNFRF